MWGCSAVRNVYPNTTNGFSVALVRDGGDCLHVLTSLPPGPVLPTDTTLAGEKEPGRERVALMGNAEGAMGV